MLLQGFEWARLQAPAGLDPKSIEAAESLERYLAHAAVGCVSSVAGGGKCGSGAASAVFGKFATNATRGLGSVEAHFVATVVAGGVGSVIAGDKFENGAKTAAYGYLFNQATSGKKGWDDINLPRAKSLLEKVSDMLNVRQNYEDGFR